MTRFQVRMVHLSTNVAHQLVEIVESPVIKFRHALKILNNKNGSLLVLLHSSVHSKLLNKLPTRIVAEGWFPAKPMGYGTFHCNQIL